MKTVSIIIPVYNVQDYIQECVESVLNQTYQDLEVFVVDDGSTDASMVKIQEIQDPRLHRLTKPNGGLSDARNFGMKHATGEYYLFVDGDDSIAPTMVEKLVKQAEETNSQIAVCDMSYVTNGVPDQFSNGGDFTVGSVQENPALIRINNSACNKLFAKSLFQNHLFPKGMYYEDLALVPILLYDASRICKVNEPFYLYRQRTGSIAHSANPKIFDIYDAIDGVVQYVQSHGNQPQVIEECKHLYILHGLELTTLRIKDFDEKEIRTEYLQKNMERLMKSYPEYRQDSFYRKAAFRKKVIYSLLGKQKYAAVLKLYDRK